MEAHQTESLFRTTFLPLHVHSGFPRLMQGGLMGVMADCLAEWTVMSTHDNIGFTTSMQMEFLKGIPAAPPSASSAIACAGGVHSVCPSRSLPQLEHLRVQAVARVTKEQGNRLVVEVLIQDLASTCVYARALIHMLLPSLGQVQRLFKGDEGKVRGYQASLANLPRPNKAVENALRLREEKAAAEKKTNKPNIAAATKSSSSPSKSPSSPSKLSSSSPSSASKPKPFHTLLPSPASLAGDEWLPLEDSLTQNIPDYNCFGCGGENESGFRSRYHVNTRTGTLRTLLAPKREWSGFPGMIQGGVATVPMDCVGSWCVMLGKQQLGLTTTMETVFLESVSLPEQESLQQQKETILILGQLISSDRTRATVVVNMYDLSSSSSGQPRLCISSRMQFALATPAMIARMLGQEYVEGVGKAMQEFKRMSEVVKKPAMEATEKGQQIKSSL
jgi:hypothetical protein